GEADLFDRRLVADIPHGLEDLCFADVAPVVVAQQGGQRGGAAAVVVLLAHDVLEADVAEAGDRQVQRRATIEQGDLRRCWAGRGEHRDGGGCGDPHVTGLAHGVAHRSGAPMTVTRMLPWRLLLAPVLITTLPTPLMPSIAASEKLTSPEIRSPPMVFPLLVAVSVWVACTCTTASWPPL